MEVVLTFVQVKPVTARSWIMQGRLEPVFWACPGQPSPKPNSMFAIQGELKYDPE